MSRTRTPLDDIAAAAANAQPAPDLRSGEPGAVPDGSEALDVADLGPDCPVQPLGSMKKLNYFLNYRGEMVDIGTKFEKGEVMQLFGTKLAWAEAKWPRWKKVGEKKGEDGRMEPIFERDPNAFDQADAQRGLILACARLPYFDPRNKVRGRGAHRGDDGELVLHCGNQVIVGGRRGARGQPLKVATHKVGLVGNYVYQLAQALPPPAAEAAPIAIGAQILVWLETWNWKRKEIDAYLILCFIAAALLGGALPRVRPHLWITGPSGAGKSTLQLFIRQLLDEWAITTEDATEAGVRQLLDQDTLAVLFDEIEPDEGNSEVHQKIVKLARLSFSGSSSTRGSQNHEARTFVAKACFLFSSIHHHELHEQDRNRIAIVHLAKFPPKTKPFVLPATIKAMGAQIRRRLIEQWHRIDETLAAYQSAMLEHGYTPREQDTYGTLLACGDLLLHDKAPVTDEFVLSLNREESRVERWVGRLGGVVDSVRSEATSTTERCLGKLTSTRLPGKPSDGQQTVARWIELAYIGVVNRSGQRNFAQEKLGEHGLRLFHLAPDHDKGNGEGGLIPAYLPEANRAIYVAVANKTHAGVCEIFAGSDWKAGNWNQPLLLVAGAIGGKKSRIGKDKGHRCTLIPLGELIDVASAEKEAEEIARQSELPGT